MPSLRIGVLGAAKIADRSTVPAMLAVDGVDVVAVAARDQARAHDFAARHGIGARSDYATIIDDSSIHAVYIPLPTSLHRKWALAALRAGKHVLCEKSLTADLAGAQEIIREARNRGLAVFENFMCETHPQSLWVRDAVGRGEIGEIRQLSLAFGFPPFPADDQRNSVELAGGALNDAGAYCLDMAVHYMGRLPERVAMVLVEGETGVDVRGAGSLDFGDGVVAQVAFGFGYDYRNEARLWGSGGQIDIDRSFSIPADRTPQVTVTRNTEAQRVELPAADQFRSQIERFRDAVGDADERERELDRRLAHAHVMQAARDAALRGAVVELEAYPDWTGIVERWGSGSDDR